MTAAPAKPGRWASLTRGRKIGIILIGVVILAALAAWIATIILRPAYPTPEEITAKYKAQAALTGGEKLYVAHCAYCHSTGFAPSIAGRAFPAEAVSAFVRMGPAGMPSFTPTQLSDAEIAQIADYVNGLPVVSEPAE